MARSVRLRRWQQRALERFLAKGQPDFLAVATPGAGKTTFALTAARVELARSGWRRIVIVVPTQHLKHQWTAAAARFDLHLEPDWSAADGLPADVHGIAVTYQQVAANPEALVAVANGSFTIFDELHHAGDERAWGEGVKLAFAGAFRRLALSGTPFRSDTSAIPFVTYRIEEAMSDFDYGYGDALADRTVVRPVYFPRVNGEMEWSAPDGSLYRATFDDPLARALANQRLRTALSIEGEWLPAVLGRAHGELARLRREQQPDAGGLVIAMDVDHARGIADLLQRRFRADAVVATSDDPEASTRIERFAAGDIPWIVAVRMVSEGVDIPRLRVGVYATNTTTELFFRQAVGRFVRYQQGIGRGRQKAFLFLPDDVRLRTYALQLAEARRHSLRKRVEDLDESFARDGEADPGELDRQGEAEQLSLFAALSATPLELPDPSVFDDGYDHDDVADLDGASGMTGPGRVAGAGGAPGGDPGGDDDPALLLTLSPPPLLAGAPWGTNTGPRGVSAGGTGGGSADVAVNPRERRRQLRDLNAAVVAQVALVSGMSHAQVNAELNRSAGVKKVTEATLPQLERRLAAGRKWLDKARTGVRR